MGHSYSFLDVQASIYGPGGNVSLAGDEAGVEQGGITVTPAGERSKMTVGADGSVMHSLLGDKSGTVSVKLLKTSSVNAALQIMYNLQTCQNCAFAKQPAITYGTDAGAVEWTFNAGSISFLLGM